MCRIARPVCPKGLKLVLAVKILTGTLKANEGNIIKTVTNNIFESTESSLGRMIINSIPKTPDATDAQANTFVAIFCITG